MSVATWKCQRDRGSVAGAFIASCLRAMADEVEEGGATPYLFAEVDWSAIPKRARRT
ncbi:MAG: hypothetical protein KGI71_04560 [Patescibacteria group bacterium]|nr:hypothetical protein [Patescibacteria group bacterium]